MNESLEILYRRHRQGLYSLAITITGSHQLAEDSVQNAFTKLFSCQLPEGDRVAYVYKTVRNSAIDIRRTVGRQTRMTESLFNGFRPVAMPSNTPPDDLLTKERHEQLREAIESLSEDEQEAVILKAFANLTFEQAGQAARVSAKTLATRYRRALLKLENQLNGKL